MLLFIGCCCKGVSAVSSEVLPRTPITYKLYELAGSAEKLPLYAVYSFRPARFLQEQNTKSKNKTQKDEGIVNER